MAKSNIPNPLSRRHLVEKEDLDQATSLKIAEAYLADGRVEEAIDFLAKAGADEQLDSIAADAIEAGDAFLLQSVLRATGGEPGPEKWLRCAEVADERGKLHYAEAARRQAARSGGSE